VGLNKFIRIQRLIVKFRIYLFNNVWGMHISPSSVISLKARLDKTNPRGVHIGANTYIAFNAAILTHDMVRALRVDTLIGDNCFIGADSIILPGVKVGNCSIVAAGSVVTKDVPPNTIVAGNPAKIIQSDIKVGKFGILQK